VTISSKDGAARIKAHPIYSSILASLPLDTPIPLAKIFAEYTHHARHLASVLVVATTFEQVLKGLEVLPNAPFLEAVAFLSNGEKARLLALLVDYLEHTTTAKELSAAQDLPISWKRAAWNKLAPEIQVRLQKIQQRRAN
jgi:hypothetical protein